MAGKPNAAFVRAVDKAGKYGDGQLGLMLLVHPGGRKQFVQRVTIRGRRCDLGLGSYPMATLARDRDQTSGESLPSDKGCDPRAKGGDTPTFAEAAKEVIKLHAASRTERGTSAGQWSSSLRTYAISSLGENNVDSISTADVMAALEPIWNTKRVTAQRVRQRISTIMKWTIAKGHRHDNPAGDAVVAALPKNGDQKIHHPAIPHADVREALSCHVRHARPLGIRSRGERTEGASVGRGEERTVPPDLRLRTVYLVELVCGTDRSVVLAEEGLRGRLDDVASKAIESARVSVPGRVSPTEPIRVKRIQYDLDERTDLPVPEAYRAAPSRDSG